VSDLVRALAQRVMELERRVDGLVRPEVMRPPVWLDSPLTSASWDGDSYSTTAKTLIDLSAVFGAPAGIKAALFFVGIRDSGSNGTDCWLILGPTNVAGSGLTADCHTVNDRWKRNCLEVPCNADGDVYYQINASGAGTMDVYLQIWAYCPGG